MKRVLFVLVLLALTAVGAALAYHTATRERDYRALLTRGDAALRDEQTYAALEAYSGAIALRPDSMLAHLRRGETYQHRGELEHAASDFRAAAALDPTATRPLNELGDVLYQRQRYRLAAETYESCRRLDDRSARVTFKLALAHYRDGDLGRARDAVKDAVRLNDRMPEAYYLLGLCLRDSRLPREAQAAFEKAVTLSPGLIPAREELADSYGAAGRRADELEQLQIVAGLDREHVERQVAIGLAHARAGRTLGATPAAKREMDLAVLTLGNALERTPDQPLIYGALGQVWLDIAQASADRLESRVALSKALEALGRITSTNAATSDVLTLYGRALLQDGQIDAAERTLQQATERYPIEPTALLFYATAAERQNHLEAARQALVQYLALVADDPEFVPHATRIATLSLRLNDIGTAIEWLQKTAVANPNDVRTLASLADAEVRYGDYDSAKATVARGLEKDPKNAQLLAIQRRLR